MPTEHFKDAIKRYNPQAMSNATIKDIFVIRLKEFDKLWKAIKNAKMLHPEQHFIIQGIRGSGKSTLLTRLAIAVEEDKGLSPWLIPILFREEEYGIFTLFTFWERIAEELNDHSLYAAQFEGLLERIETLENDPKAAFKLLDTYLSKANKKIILLIDNLAELFNVFTKNEEEILREVLSQNNNLRIIGGSAISMENFYDNSAPFYQFFKIITLKEINQQDAIQLLEKLGNYYGPTEAEKINRIIAEEPEKIETLRRLTGGIPRTIVLLFDILIEGSNGSSFKYLEETLDKVTPIYKHRIDDLSKQQKPIIHAIAMNWDAISVKEIAQQTRIDSKQVSAQLNQLQKQWIISKIPTSTKNHLYALEERFFNIWYLMRYGRRKERNKLIWLTRFFEIWCSKEELSKQAVLFHKALSQTQNPRGAMLYASALIGCHQLDMNERKHIYQATCTHLEQAGYADLVNELPQIASDNEIKPEKQRLSAGQSYEQQEVEYRLAIAQGDTSSYNNLGILLAEQKQYDEAETNFRLALEQGDTVAYFNLGYLFHQLKRYDEAEVNYRLALEHGQTVAYCNLGVLFRELKRFDEAEANYRLALEHGDTDAYLNLGVLFREIKRFDEAEANYRLALEHGDTDAYISLGVLFHELKRFNETEANLRLALEHGDTDAYINLGVLFHELKRFDEAEANLRLALEQGDTDAYFNLGYLFRELKRYDEAEANYRQALEHGDTDAYIYLGNLFRELKRYDEAEANYRLSLEHGDMDAYINLGYLFWELKRYDEAEAFLRLALEHGDTDAYFNLGVLFRELKRYDEAETNYRLALEHGDMDAYINLGYLFWELKRYDEAEAFLRLAVEQGDTDAYIYLGSLLRELKRYDEAEANYRLALEHGDTNAYFNLGDLFSKLKRYDEAEAIFKQGIVSGVDELENTLAWLYFETNQVDKKGASLALAQSAVAKDACFAYLHTLAAVALWQGEIDIAKDAIETILLEESWLQTTEWEKEFIELLLLLLAKGQTNLFDKWLKQFDLADRLKPLYFAYLQLVPHRYPDQALKMGSDLKETVDEILAKIRVLKDRYEGQD